MAFTAQDVKTLREITGVGMMDCKKALAACDGDQEKAIEFLREKGLAAAEKKAGRIAAEGMAYAVSRDGVGVIVEVNAESDFVAKNELFIDYVEKVAQVIAERDPADLEALFAAEYPGEGKTVQEVQNDKVLVIGENIKVRRFRRFAAGVSVPYVHMGGRIAVLLNMEVAAELKDNESVIELGKDLAMQVAALRPEFLDKSVVPAEFIEKEKEIRINQAKQDPKNANKPEHIMEKIVAGGLNKYLGEICLMQQAFVKNDKVSVENHVREISKKLGSEIKISSYVRYERGEGIEKRSDDLAAEVAKLVK